MAAVVAEKIIRIDVIASANAQRTINAMASDMKKVETAAANMQRTMSTGFGGINSILGKVTGFLGAFGVTAGMGAVTQWVIDAASSWQVLESRLTLVLGSTEKARRATVDIADIAKLTGREIDGVAKLYEKASRSAQQFGISEDQVKQITLGFSQSIRLSGASTQEAYAALVQFGQALASGRLQGDEFRSLMENNAVFMYEFAKAAGLTVAQLRKMGTEGKLSAKFLFDTMAKEGADALNMMERLNKMAKEVPLTFRQSFTAINSAATEFVGTFTLLFSSKSGDQYGVFGNWIRGLTAMTDRLRDLKIISDALGEGFWARLARLYKSESALAGGTDSVAGAAAAALGLTSGRRDTLLDSLKAEREGKLKEIQRLGAGVAREEKFFTQAFGPEKSSYPAGSKEQARLEILNERRDQLNALLETYQRLRIEERKLEYGEGFYGDPKVDNKEPDPDAERRLKTARSSLEDFAKARQRDADATWDILLGREEEKKAAREMAMLQEKLTEALVKGDSAQANAIRTDIRRAELGRKLIDELEDTRNSADTNAARHRSPGSPGQQDKSYGRVHRSQAPHAARRCRRRASCLGPARTARLRTARIPERSYPGTGKSGQCEARFHGRTPGRQAARRSTHSRCRQ